MIWDAFGKMADDHTKEARVPNFGTVLKEEIARLSRREARRQVDATRKATVQHRRHIATLKRQVAQLERQVSLLARKVSDTPKVAAHGAGNRPRFVAKGLRSQRNRVGLSASEYATLMGVSAQSIYNWERGVTRPSEEQLPRLAALRGIGKREAVRRLEQLGRGGDRR